MARVTRPCQVLTAAHRFALSFLSSVRAVPPGTGRPGHLRADICQRWALCPRILLGEFPQGLGLLPRMLPSLPASRDPALFSPTVLCRWPFGMEIPSGGNFWLLHWCRPAHHPAGRPEGEDLNGTASLVPVEARTKVLLGCCRCPHLTPCLEKWGRPPRLQAHR